jgi:hypothetical protein
MGPLRDVVARFTTVVDTSAMEGLGTKIEKLKGNYGALAFAGTAALAALAGGSLRFIQAASKVDEVDNKISAIFGKDRQNDIVAWSKTVEKEMGRSEYSFRQTFSDFAAFLDPMKIGTERTIEFSKQLSKLSVDLASFYDTSEKEAQMRLFSGMAGETEAVRRLGIDISDTSLAALYNSKDNPLSPGNPGQSPGKKRNKGKGLASLSLQEKTILRYHKIMTDTVKAQGDAARTAGGWANTLKRLTDRFVRFEVAMGRMLKGPGVKFLNILEAIVVKMEYLVTKTSAVQTVVALLGATAVGATLKWLDGIKNLNMVLARTGLMVFKIAGAFLILEDFITFLNDGESGFGKLVQALEEVENPARVIKDLFADILSYLDKISTRDVPILGFFARGMDLATGGSFMDTAEDEARRAARDRVFSGEAVRQRAAERRAAQAEAVKNGDIKAFRENRGVNDSYEGSRAEFLPQRAKYLSANPTEANGEDRRAGLATRPDASGAFKVGNITVAPVINITAGPMKAEELERTVKNAVHQSAKDAAAALKRGKRKE